MSKPNWLAPLAAATAVALAAVTAVLTTEPHADAALSATPEYFAEFWIKGHVMVRSTASGKVDWWVTEPADVAGLSLAAGPDGRTFYMGTANPESGNAIYSFQVTGHGVTPMHMISGGAVEPAGATVDGLAVSPDGTELAVAVDDDPWGLAQTLIVIDLRTGAHHVWKGGLPLWVNHVAEGVNIQDLSWSGNQTLDFVTSWCPNDIWAYCGPGTAQVRAVNVASGGGSLAASTVVLGDLARFPKITSVVADLQGHLTIMQVSGRTLLESAATVTVEQVSAADGAVLRVLYQRRVAAEPDSFASLIADPSGQHLLLWIDDSLHGWLDQGVLRPLPLGALPQVAW